MSEAKLRQLLSALPGEEEIARRAAQARRRALARLEERAPARLGWWCWAPGPAFILAAVIWIWVNHVWRVEPLAWTPPVPRIASAPLVAATPAPKPVCHRAPQPALAQQRLELHWVLSDGTRVQWIFDKNFGL